MTDARSKVERWMVGECERPDDAEIKYALETLSALAAMGMDGTARLAIDAEAMCASYDESFSARDWVRGYHAGCAATWQRIQQALAHLANAIKMRATR